MENRLYKVSHEGGTFVTGMFYNPVTGEEVHKVLRDYDYSDGSRDNDELYFMDIDEDARRLWLHSKGHILPGDTVEVVKGRTITHGTVITVKDVRPYKDRYGRIQAYYIYATDGRKINIDNCKLKEVAR